MTSEDTNCVQEDDKPKRMSSFTLANDLFNNFLLGCEYEEKYSKSQRQYFSRKMYNGHEENSRSQSSCLNHLEYGSVQSSTNRVEGSGLYEIDQNNEEVVNTSIGGDNENGFIVMNGEDDRMTNEECEVKSSTIPNRKRRNQLKDDDDDDEYSPCKEENDQKASQKTLVCEYGITCLIIIRRQRTLLRLLRKLRKLSILTMLKARLFLLVVVLSINLICVISVRMRNGRNVWIFNSLTFSMLSAIMKKRVKLSRI